MPPQMGKRRPRPPPPPSSIYVRPYDVRAVPDVKPIDSRTRTSIIDANTSGQFTGQEKRIVLGCEWYFKPEGVDHVKKTFHNAILSAKDTACLQLPVVVWDDENYVWAVVSTGGVDAVSRELHRAITSTITQEHLDGYVSDDDDDQGDVALYYNSEDEEVEYISRLIVRLSVWKRKNNRPEDDVPKYDMERNVIEEEDEEDLAEEDISDSIPKIFPQALNACPFKDSIQYTDNDTLITDDDLAEVSSLTNTKCEKSIYLQKVYVGGDSEDVQRALGKLHNIQKSSAITENAFIDHIFFTANEKSVQFRFKLLGEVNRPHNSDSSSDAHARYFRTTLLDNLAIYPAHNYANLHQCLGIRCSTWDIHKASYEPSKFSRRIIPVTASQNVDNNPWRFWNSYEFRSIGDESKNHVKQAEIEDNARGRQDGVRQDTTDVDSFNPANANTTAVMGWAAEVPDNGAVQYLRNMPAQSPPLAEVNKGFKQKPYQDIQRNPSWDTSSKAIKEQTNDPNTTTNYLSPSPSTQVPQGNLSNQLPSRARLSRMIRRDAPQDFQQAMGLTKETFLEDCRGEPSLNTNVAGHGSTSAQKPMPPMSTFPDNIQVATSQTVESGLQGNIGYSIITELDGLEFRPRERTLIDDDIYLSDDKPFALGPALEPSRSSTMPFRNLEKVQQNDEVSSREYYGTMNQKAPRHTMNTLRGRGKNHGSAFSGQLELPSTPITRSQKSSLAQVAKSSSNGFHTPTEYKSSFEALLGNLHHFRGEACLRMDFGRIMVRNVPQKHITKRDSTKSYDYQEILDILNRGNDSDTTPRTWFTSVLTTVPSDIQYLIDMKEGGRRLWEELRDHSINTDRCALVYEIIVHENGASGYQQFTIDIDGDQNNGSFTTKTTKQFGSIYIHATKQQWDGRISATGSTIVVDPRHLYNRFAEMIKNSLHLHVDPGHMMPVLDFEVHSSVLGDDKLTLDGVRVHRKVNYKSTDGLSLLHIDEVHDLDVSLRQFGKDFTLYRAVAHSQWRPAVVKVDSWYEVSISSLNIDEQLRKNHQLELGDNAEWSPENLSSHCAQDIYLPTCEMLQKMDGVGFWNENDVNDIVPDSFSQPDQVPYEFW